MRALKKSSKIMGLVSLGAFGTVAALGLLSKIEHTPPELPTGRSIYVNFNYSNTTFDKMLAEDKHSNRLILEEELRKAEQAFEKMKKEKPKDYNKFMHELQNEKVFRKHNKRLGTALIRTCKLIGKHDMEHLYSNFRIGFTVVPRSFISMHHGSSPSYVNEWNGIQYGLEYLMHCTNTNTKVSKIYSNYFLEADEMMGAIEKAGTDSYFSKTVKSLPGNMGTGSDHILPGFRSYIPEEKRQLIDLAFGLYMVTDNDGNLNFRKIPTLRAPSKDLLKDKDYVSK